MNDQNDLTVSDQLGFWELHVHRPLGYQPPPEPAPAPVLEAEPDVSAMSMQEWAQTREHFGLHDTGDFIGVSRWHRPIPTPIINEQENPSS